jgi:hypothetical protein
VTRYHARRRGTFRRARYWLSLVAGAAVFLFVGWVLIVAALLVTP